MAITVDRKKFQEPPVKRKFPTAAEQAEAYRANGNGAFPGKDQPATHHSPLSTRTVAELPIDKIHRHPENRSIERESQAVKDLAASIRAESLLNPIIVRTLPPGPSLYADQVPLGHYQLIAGERRLLACQLLDWETIHAYVYEGMPDRQALEWLNIDNAQRQDLSTVEKARAIQRLHDDVAAGGAGLTWEQAGAIYGMSASGAQNLVALLKAPVVWLKRMDDLDAKKPVHQATVREIAKFAEWPKLIEAIDKEYTKGWWPRDRDDQVAEIARTVRYACGDIEGKHHSRIPGDYKAHPCYLDTSDAKVREDLEIVALPIGLKGKLVEMALNKKEFEKRQEAEIKKRVGKEVKKAKERTPAQQKALEAKQDHQLAKQIRAWRYQFLRLGCCQALACDWRLGVLAAVLCAEARAANPYRTFDAAPYLWEAAEEDSTRRSTRGRDLWKAVDKRLGDHGDINAEELLRLFVGYILWPRPVRDEPVKDADGWALSAKLPPEDMPTIADDLVDWIAGFLGVNFAGEWRASAETPAKETEGRQMFRRFLELHNSRQLRKLIADSNWGGTAKCAEAPKGKLIEAVMECHALGHALPIPRCLGGKAKGGRPRKARKARK